MKVLRQTAVALSALSALFALLVLCMTLVPAVYALPTAHRPGANHHLGDDSFVARFGRAPASADHEALRMSVHLQYIRQQLGAGHATMPEHEARRAQLLGYLDDYITQGTTPVNTYVPWRSPVFIDANGSICAVGYLIERSVGRALAERIAATHRLDYLEAIAVAMPEVAAWVATAGFTLTELAAIQPGYQGPDVMHLAGWVGKQGGKQSDRDVSRTGQPRPSDGPYRDDEGFEGQFAQGQMQGPWRQTQNGAVRGRGVFHRGAGSWKSLRADGTLLAEGPFRASHADGAWRFYHPAGRLAAAGTMRAGKRDGAWRFYYDASGSPLLAAGEFVRGEVRGQWKHYAANGALIATASGRAGLGFTLKAEPGSDGVRRLVHQGLPADSFRVDGFFLRGDKLYITNEGHMSDAEGNQVTRHGGTWQLHACRRSAAYKTAARTGNVKALFFHHRHAMARSEGEQADCERAPTPVAAIRARHLNRMLASRDALHVAVPAFSVDPVWEKAQQSANGEDEPRASSERPATGNPKDMVTYLANHMTWYIEFPHVDRTFARVYASLPGYNLAPGKS